MTSASRSHGIDVARGLAVVLMIQTHAYDGWVRKDARQSLAFQLTRWLGTLPLPLFLALAGIAVGLRVRKAHDRQSSARDLRRTLVKTGTRVLAWGYALNLAYALLDGGAGLSTLLRVDVLHAIGLVILGLAACVGGGPTPPEPRRFAGRSAVLACAALAFCPLATRLGHALTGATRFLLAPWVEVPGLSSMPFLPLAFFCGAFAACAACWRLEALSTSQTWQTLGAFTLCYAAGEVASQACQALGIPIARTSPGIWANALSSSGRAGLVITLLARFTRRPAPGVNVLHAFGQHSLLVYGLHLPFCYGRFARPIKQALSFGDASAFLLLLCALCALAVWARTKLEKLPALRRRLS